MATKAKSRKKSVKKNRPLLPALPRRQQAAAVAVGADIWMTAPLKEAAMALQNSWSSSHDEHMAELEVQDVKLKFAGAEKQMAFYEALVNLAKLVNLNFPSTYPLPKPTHPHRQAVRMKFG